tara:strand:- start:449 stop:640 length:192 start_codon:yes stop_codon:yes gene_type:complete
MTKNELIEQVKEKLDYVKSFEKATWLAYITAEDEESRIDACNALTDLEEDLAKFQKKLESLQS